MKVKINNLDVNFQVYGEGTPILLIHGYTLDLRSMTGSFEPVFESTSGWKRIYLDLPGMGASEANDQVNTSDDMLTIVIAFIKKMIPDEMFAIAGLSYGGYLAKGLMQHFFERVCGIAFVVPAVYFEIDKREVPEFRVFQRDTHFLDKLDEDNSAGFKGICTIQNKKTWNLYYEQIISGVTCCNQEVINRILNTEFDQHDKTLPIPFEKPALFILGRNDSTVGYKDSWKLYESYPRGTFVVLDRSGHCPQIDQQKMFRFLIQDWLERISLEEKGT